MKFILNVIIYKSFKLGREEKNFWLELDRHFLGKTKILCIGNNKLATTTKRTKLVYDAYQILVFT